MFTDLNGKRRLKIGLHTHTKRSDGRLTAEEAMALYAAAGYDMLALTDHWYYNPNGEFNGMKIIAGCEYDFFGPNSEGGISETFHILGLGMTRDPEIPRSLQSDRTIPVRQRARMAVQMIRDAGGAAVLAHPAWSLNTPVQILESGDYDALEIYNSVSEQGMSDRPYSGLLVDMIAAEGVCYPLLATDDTHYYDCDEMKGMIMAEADAVEQLGFVEMLRQKRFYATQGPEIHLERVSEDTVKLRCSEAAKIAFLSNLPWTTGRMIRGEGLTEAEYLLKLNAKERYIRAEVTDARGLCAWSNVIFLNEE